MKTHHFLVMLALWFSGFALADDETDFAAPPPANWVRNDPLGIGTYDYTGGRLKVSCPAVPPEIAQFAGPGRVQLFAPTSYTQCAVSVDVTGWSATRTFAAIGLRLSNPGAGTTCGYALAFVPSIGVVEIHRLDNEVPTMISVSEPTPAETGHAYRLVFTAAGGFLTGRVFDLADLTNPVAQVTAFDTTYVSGVTALSVSTDQLVPIEATFDNFLAWDGTPPPLQIARGEGTVILKANGPRSLAASFQMTDELGTSWTPTFPLSSTVGSVMECHFAMNAPRRFYRMKLLGAP